MDPRVDGVIGLLRGMGSEGASRAADAVERLRSEVDEWRAAAEAWFPIPEDMVELSRAIGGAIGRQDVVIPRMLALRLYQSLEAGRRAVGVWKGEAGRINAALTEDVERLAAEVKRLRDTRDELVAACQAARAFGSQGETHEGFSVSEMLRAAVANASDAGTPPGPPDPPRPKCGRCRCPYNLHDRRTGECARCDCPGYLYPEAS
jgi:hypothetical protein